MFGALLANVSSIAWHATAPATERGMPGVGNRRALSGYLHQSQWLTVGGVLLKNTAPKSRSTAVGSTPLTHAADVLPGYGRIKASSPSLTATKPRIAVQVAACPVRQLQPFQWLAGLAGDPGLPTILPQGR